MQKKEKEREKRKKKNKTRNGSPPTSSEDELVDIGQQGLNHSDLARHLGATNNRAEWSLWLRNSSVEVVELLLEKESSYGWREELGDSFSGGMSTMSGSKGIVNVPVRKSKGRRREREREDMT